MNKYLTDSAAAASPAAAQPPVAAQPYRYKPTSNVSGLSAMKTDADAVGGNDKQQGNEYYAGGSASGQAVIDPAKKEAGAPHLLSVCTHIANTRSGLVQHPLTVC
eukprot:SAG22_NODE_6732_length_818_cov_1.212796_1_plen_105_part_00